MTPSTTQHLTSAEAAAILRVSPTLLRRWATGGRLSVAKTLGGHRLFQLDDVLALRTSRTIQTPARA